MYYKFLNEYFVWVDILIFSIIPFIIMCSSTLIIASRIRSTRRRFLRMNSASVNRISYFRRLKRDRQLLLMLLISNLYFIISSLPYCLGLVLHMDKEIENPVSQMIIHVISYTNNGINFAFYGLSSQIYRKEFRKLFSRNKPTYL